MVKARKYVVKKRFEGVPKPDDFEVVESDLPPIQNDEILVKTEWVSVDPYQRAFNFSQQIPYEQFGFQVGIVQDSRNSKYPVGSRVATGTGWCDYFIINPCKPKPDIFNYNIQKLPDLKDMSPSLAVGALGMVGATAYFGFLDICRPKEGETVVVTSAAGGVGSIVGQIAKIKGCNVIGFTGSDDKVEFLKKDLRFDNAFNYKTVDITAALNEAAPDGVDCYFDNVGGEISSFIINKMKPFGRVSVCGSISAYNAVSLESPRAPILQPSVVLKELKMEGFVIMRWLDRWPEAFAVLAEWISSGQLQIKEHVTEGFDNIHDAFIGMLVGENIGKAIVKI